MKVLTFECKDDDCLITYNTLLPCGRRCRACGGLNIIRLEQNPYKMFTGVHRALYEQEERATAKIKNKEKSLTKEFYASSI